MCLCHQAVKFGIGIKKTGKVTADYGTDGIYRLYSMQKTGPIATCPIEQSRANTSQSYER